MVDQNFGPNEGFVATLYTAYKAGDTQVGEQWQELFRQWEKDGIPPIASNYHSESTANSDPHTTQQAIHPLRAQTTAAETNVTRSDLPPAPRSAAHPARTPYTAKYDTAPNYAKNFSEDQDEDEIVPLKGAERSLAKNMDVSLKIPTATSVRAIPARVMFDNRAVINKHLSSTRGGKVSFTHFIAYAMVEALVEMPELTYSYKLDEKGKPSLVKPAQINLGIAIDETKPDGSHTLVVPNIKNAERLTFSKFLSAYEDLISRGRNHRLTPSDFHGTTATLTNPGGLGTTHSIPRLMSGQGLIVGVGALAYPAEFQGASNATISRLGISKVLHLTSTYDHRVIQGANSGRFLKLIEQKLLGLDGFYERIYMALRVPFKPFTWERDIEYDAEREMGKPARIAELIHSYRSRGHLIADTDPLSFRVRRHPDLELKFYGLTLWDLDRTFPTDGFAGFTHATLREILSQLRESYCGTVGIEYMHIQDPLQRRWFQERIERPTPPTPEKIKRNILHYLNQAEAFEVFLQTKYVGQKRFSLEGGESLIPAIATILQEASHDGLSQAAIGMSHRGRLNVLTNIAGKSYAQIFSEFDGIFDPSTQQGTGDVKYHLGTEGIFTSPDGEQISVYLAANPSHLEAANGVLEGVVRAKQDRLNTGDTSYPVLPILIHGDSAIAGQGVVAEVLNYSQLPAYRTGGTIHIVVNNQIGFTTAPSSARSSRYATDFAKGLQCPIFHVNGDDPEAVVRISKLAYDYRQAFQKDVLVDITCYRRRGHNEGDDPSMTQPIMYSLVSAKRTTRHLYAESLIGRGELTSAQFTEIEKDFQNLLESAFLEVKEAEKRVQLDSTLTAATALGLPKAQVDEESTIVGWESATSPAVLARIGEAHTTPPEEFKLHKKIAQLYAKRATLAHGGEGGEIDWGFAEILAFGSLLIDGVPVRLSGQDCRRGTFVQRHATAHCVETGREWTPLSNLTQTQAEINIYDSSLSEYSVLAFEYGYSVERPDALVLWEAQFGDFANGAQIVIDEFVSSAAQKWAQNSGLVMLLPHGFEGQGPDHSSARIERYLQLCAQENMIVTQPSTPANYFHLLRRQAFMRPRKPLIVFTPKQLLRRKAAVSLLADFSHGAFQPVIGQLVENPAEIKRVLMCSGRIYYDLVEAQEKHHKTNTAIVRIEQLYPNPIEELQAEISKYPHAEFFWVQDEPQNQGAWSYFALELFPQIGISPKLISRPRAAAPATGITAIHRAQIADILDSAFKNI